MAAEGRVRRYTRYTHTVRKLFHFCTVLLQPECSVVISGNRFKPLPTGKAGNRHAKCELAFLFTCVGWNPAKNNNLSELQGRKKKQNTLEGFVYKQKRV